MAYLISWTYADKLHTFKCMIYFHNVRQQAHKKTSDKTGFTLVCYSFKSIIFFFLGKVKQNPFPAKQKRPEHLISQAFQPSLEQGMRESNSRQRFWRPLSYHLTNPLYIKYYEGTALIYYIHLSFVFQYLFFCTFKTSHRLFHTNFTLATKNGHLDYALLRLDVFAPQTSTRQPSQLCK